MSNVHHIRNLGQGSGQWNAWREKEPDVNPDLAQADLKETNLAGMDLNGTILSQANLKKSNLSGSNLQDANLAGANLEEVNLAGANLEGANIAGAYLLNSNLSGCNLTGANLSGAGLAGKVDLSGANLTGANLAGARLVGAKLSGANFTRANLAGADFREADLTGCCLSGADTSGAKFEGADLGGTILHAAGERFGGQEEAKEASASEDDPLQEPAPFRISPAPDFEPGIPEPLPVEAAGPETVPPLEAPAKAPERNAELLDSFPPLEDLLLDGTLQEPEPPATPRPAVSEPVPAAPVPRENAEEDNFVYQNKDLAILALFPPDFAGRGADEKRDFLELFARYIQRYLQVSAAVPMTTIGNAVLGGFENPNQALLCAQGYLDALKGMNVSVSASINMGSATVRRARDSTLEEIVPNSISPGARLEPLSCPGEVLVLEDLYAHPSTDKDRFEFTKVSRRWQKISDIDHEGVSITCYLVKPR